MCANTIFNTCDCTFSKMNMSENDERNEMTILDILGSRHTQYKIHTIVYIYFFKLD